MRFMTLWRPGKNARPMSPELGSEMAALTEEMKRAGVLLESGGWDPNGPATLMRSAGGEVSVTDGPFTETKEMVAGFALLDVASKEEAIAWCKRFLAIAGEGTSEMRSLD